MTVAPEGLMVVPDTVTADAPVKVTVPKLANGTSEQLEPLELQVSKSSTIHSALNSQSLALDDKVLVTVVPLLLFLIVRVPAVVLEAAAVRVTESPAENVMPVKSLAKSGKYSYQASWNLSSASLTHHGLRFRLPSNETAVPWTQKSSPVCKIAESQVSPSMPTQAEAHCSALPPVLLGVGTVNVPVTVLYVALLQKSDTRSECLSVV